MDTASEDFSNCHSVHTSICSVPSRTDRIFFFFYLTEAEMHLFKDTLLIKTKVSRKGKKKKKSPAYLAGIEHTTSRVFAHELCALLLYSANEL